MEETKLTNLKAGQTAVVKEIRGGEGVSHRLSSLGIRPGKEITHVSSHFWRGPVTVRIGRAKVAIGYGMAQKIVVEVK
ncbi:MAG: FeoA family protein [Candidatus Tantalella remota]|nr:FeoA family protein [Candidatus Tantalella remota]